MRITRFAKVVIVVLLGLQPSLLLAQAMPEYGGILKRGARPPAFRFPDLNLPSQQTASAKSGSTAGSTQSIGDIAFITDGDVRTVTLDGKTVRRLTTDGRNAFPMWSPSGRYIAFSKYEQVTQKEGRPAPSASLWVVTTDGKYSKRIAQGGLYGAVYPAAWLPDSSGLVVNKITLNSELFPVMTVVTLNGKAYPPLSRWRSAVMKVGAAPPLGDGFAMGGAGFAFSGNGREMIFTADSGSDPENPFLDLYRMNVNGTNLRRLARMPRVWVDCLRWHPSAAKVLSAEYRANTAGIWLRSADGKYSKILADLPDVSFSEMDWSRDGNCIVYQVSDREYPRFEHPEEFDTLSTHASIWAMNADGTGKYKLADNACHPDWR